MMQQIAPIFAKSCLLCWHYAGIMLDAFGHVLAMLKLCQQIIYIANYLRSVRHALIIKIQNYIPYIIFTPHDNIFIISNTIIWYSYSIQY